MRRLGVRTGENQAQIPAIQAGSVSRRFGDKQALVDVSLVVPHGRIHALLGPNGAGKTTFVRILTGLLEPDEGNIEILGRSLREFQSRQYKKFFGFVPSGDRTFYLRISGIENLAFFARLYGMSRRDALRRGWECIRDVGLEEAARKPVGLYSHGMQKRLSVARGLLMDPAVLFVDEATHDLDPEGARNVRALVQAAAGRGAAVIWTTQRVEEIWDFAHSVTLLHNGRIRFAGTVPEMIRFSRSQSYVIQLRPVDERRQDLVAELTTAAQDVAEVHATRESTDHFIFALRPEAILGDLFERLTANGIEILDCRQEHSQIEQAFLRLTSESR